jgi:hypothetical protein
MKILKKIGIGLLALIALLLIAAIFIPKDYTVSVSTTINKPKKEVFDYIKFIKNQAYYSVWVMEDPNVEMTYTGTDGTVGFISAWTSANGNVGVGEQEITKITEDRIDMDLRFKKPFEGNSKAATFLKELSPTQTEITTEFYGHESYPMNLMSIIGKSIIEKAETTNLKNLKTILEK